MVFIEMFIVSLLIVRRLEMTEVSHLVFSSSIMAPVVFNLYNFRLGTFLRKN